MKFLGRVNLKDFKREQNTPTAISLFSGCGGMDLGMKQAGFEIRVMVENDPICCQTLALNFVIPDKRLKRFKKKRRNPVIIERDIREVSTEEILHRADLKVGEATVVTGGFPCQGFSTSGKRVVNDPRNSLYLQCVRVVREALPRFFIFENVPGLVSMSGGAIIDRLCQDLALCGYATRWDILDAADYGVPQRRRRVFFLGQRQDLVRLDGKKISVHMAVKGQVIHPDFFLKRYPRFRESVERDFLPEEPKENRPCLKL